MNSFEMSFRSVLLLIFNICKSTENVDVRNYKDMHTLNLVFSAPISRQAQTPLKSSFLFKQSFNVKPVFFPSNTSRKPTENPAVESGATVVLFAVVETSATRAVTERLLGVSSLHWAVQREWMTSSDNAHMVPVPIIHILQSSRSGFNASGLPVIVEAPQTLGRVHVTNSYVYEWHQMEKAASSKNAKVWRKSL